MNFTDFTIFGDDSSAFWTMLSFVAIATSFYFLIKQLKLQNNANEIHFIEGFEKRWWNNENKELRKKVCNSSSLDIDADTERLLGFFEDLGILYNKKVVNKHLIWEKFSYYIEHYWPILKPKVMNFQETKNDKTWYCHFKKLHNKIHKISLKKTKNKKYKISEEDIEKFKRSEIKI